MDQHPLQLVRLINTGKAKAEFSPDKLRERYPALNEQDADRLSAEFAAALASVASDVEFWQSQSPDLVADALSRSIHSLSSNGIKIGPPVLRIPGFK